MQYNQSPIRTLRSINQLHCHRPVLQYTHLHHVRVAVPLQLHFLQRCRGVRRQTHRQTKVRRRSRRCDFSLRMCQFVHCRRTEAEWERCLLPLDAIALSVEVPAFTPQKVDEVSTRETFRNTRGRILYRAYACSLSRNLRESAAGNGVSKVDERDHVHCAAIVIISICRWQGLVCFCLETMDFKDFGVKIGCSVCHDKCVCVC